MSTNDIRKKAPHVAILSIQLEVCEIDQLGQCSGRTVPQSELKEAGIESSFLLRVDGWDKQDCINKLKQRLDQFKNGEPKRGELYGQ